MDAQEREAWLKDRLKWRLGVESRMTVIARVLIFFVYAIFGFVFASWVFEGINIVAWLGVSMTFFGVAMALFGVTMAFLGALAFTHAQAHKAAREELTVLWSLLEVEDQLAKDTE